MGHSAGSSHSYSPPGQSSPRRRKRRKRPARSGNRRKLTGSWRESAVRRRRTPRALPWRSSFVPVDSVLVMARQSQEVDVLEPWGHGAKGGPWGGSRKSADLVLAGHTGAAHDLY